MKLNFCYLIRSAIISGVKEAFHTSLMCMSNTLELKTLAQRVFKKF